MSDVLELVPDWATGTTPGVHDMPGENRRLPPMDWKDLSRRIRFMLDTFLGNVAKAFGAIEILGWKPFNFLAKWGQDRIDRANEAYAAAMGAQSAANYANTQLIMLNGTGLATEVPGGVAINEFFDEPVGNALTNFTRSSSGAGGGHYGPDGAGHAVWKRSGGQPRRHVDRHNTALATRYQVVMVLMSTIPQSGSNGGPPVTELHARMNSTNSTYCYAQIRRGRLEVGCAVSGSQTVFGSIDVPWTDGDVVHFICGTDVDDREFVVKRNGVTVWRDTDDAAVSQVDDVDYLRVGLTSLAYDRQFFTTQSVPAELDIWAAADRLPSNI